MLTSINPLGERARRQRYAVTVGFYLAGSLLGGATAGGALGAAGGLLGRGAATLPLAALGCALAAVADLAGLPPYGHRQVDQRWLTRYRGWVYGGGFGYQLGLGVVTVVTSAATYALLLLCLLSGSAAAGALLGTTFGLVRALPVLSVARVSTAEALHRAGTRLDRLARPAAAGTVGVLVAAAGGLALTALTGAAP